MKVINMQHRLGSSVLALALLFGGLWLLTGCTPNDGGETTKPVTSTTLSFDDAPTEESPQTFDGDGVMEVLVNDVPVLADYSYGDIRSMLLDTVCTEIDNADGDFADVGDSIVEASASNFEFDYSDAGYIVAAAVILECPEWQDAAREFADSEG